mgnify:CR=1 FL=1
MRETLFRLLAGVLAVLILVAGGVVLVTDARLVGSWLDALWMGGVGILLLSTFTVMAIVGPKRAHQILARGMKLLGMVGDEDVPERLDPPGRDGERAVEGQGEGPEECRAGEGER